MPSFSSKRFAAIVLTSILLGCGGGGGDGGGTTANLPPASLVISPTAVNIGAVGSTKQMTTIYKDANGTTVAGSAVTFALGGSGAVASVTTAGLVTAVGAGQGDTVIASGNGLTAKAPIFVTQIPASLVVTSTISTPDTLFAATRTRQFSAVAKDSNNNAISSPAIVWSSGTTTVATVNAASGLVTAVADGNSSIQAAAGTAVASRPIIVRRLAQTHSLLPGTGTITVSGGSAGPFNGIATDSNGSAIPLTFVSRSASIFITSGANATSTSIVGVGNGTASLVMTIPSTPTGLDSSTITVSGQPLIPGTASVTVGDFFFKSVHNTTQNPAVDTIAAGGTVTWTFTGAAAHGIGSTGTPSFTSQVSAQITGTHSQTFSTVGVYQYDCIVHGSLMTGTVVVR